MAFCPRTTPALTRHTVRRVSLCSAPPLTKRPVMEDGHQRPQHDPAQADTRPTHPTAKRPPASGRPRQTAITIATQVRSSGPVFRPLPSSGRGSDNNALGASGTSHARLFAYSAESGSGNRGLPLTRQPHRHPRHFPSFPSAFAAGRESLSHPQSPHQNPVPPVHIPVPTYCLMRCSRVREGTRNETTSPAFRRRASFPRPEHLSSNGR